MRPTIWLILVLLTGVLSAAAQQEPARQTPIAVGVQTVEPSTDARGVRSAADIRPSRQVDLAFRVGGYIQELLQSQGPDGQRRDVQEGDRVTRGTTLARVRDLDYVVKLNQARAQLAEVQATQEQARAQLVEAQAGQEQARAQLVEVQAAQDQARLDFERTSHLFAQQSVTRPEYEASKARFETTQARVDSARAQLVLVQATVDRARAQRRVLQARLQGAQAQVEEAGLALQDSALKAPFNAVVLKRPIEVGTLVGPASVAFVLADTAAVKVVFGAPDTMVQRLQLGHTLVISTAAVPGVEFRGPITRLAPAADPKSRVFEVEVTLPNLHSQLNIGSIGSIQVVEATTGPAFVVPLAAIVRSKGQPTGYTVFVVQEQDGKQVARLRHVKLGNTSGTTVAVLEGVTSGDRVITTGTTLIVDGTPVQIMP